MPRGGGVAVGAAVAVEVAVAVQVAVARIEPRSKLRLPAHAPERGALPDC
jgi:hypothetical protein